MANPEEMRPELSTARARRNLAPFVGVALASLTIGSLVTFSLVAQKTSLEGFSARGVIAEAPVASSPPSIVVPVPADGATDAEATTPDVSSAPEPAATVLLVPRATDPAPTTVARVAGPPTNDGRDPDASTKTAPRRELPTGGLAASKTDDGHGSSAEARDGKKPKKAKSHEQSQSRGNSGHGRPQHAGPPPSKPKPARRAAKPAHTPVAKGHQKARGNGHHKDRGRGHDKD